MNAKLIGRIAGLFSIIGIYSYAQAAFPGANGAICFMEGNFPYEYLGKINPDGSGNIAIYQDSERRVLFPTYSKDGTKIAFTLGGGNIYIVNDNGTQSKLLVTGNEEGQPTWDPTGNKIAYVALGDDREGDIFIINIDGTNKKKLTNSVNTDECPAFSPDGKRIAFVSHRSGRPELYLMNADGSNQHNITTTGSHCFPDWSPDGNKIVTAYYGMLFTINADGSDRKNLTQGGYPSWSPDGTQIVFDSEGDGIYKINTDGTNRVKIRDGNMPSWQPIPITNSTITVDDTGFTPASIKVRQRQEVKWEFLGTTEQSVIDDSLFGAFGSGIEPVGGAYAATFYDAGTFPIFEPTTSQTGKVQVKLRIDPNSGPVGTSFKVAWSSRKKLPSSFLFDVQKKLPGATEWVYHLRGVTDKKMTIAPTTVGKYQFRSRVRNSTGAADWSPAGSFTVE
jgi:hypothetical protein